MDIRTRQGLLNALVGKVGKRMDTLLIPLELLCCVSRTEFSDKKAFIRWQKRQVSSAPFSIILFLDCIGSLQGNLEWWYYISPTSMVKNFNCLLVQLNILEEGLINYPVVGFGESGRKSSELRILLAKIEEAEVCVSLINIFDCCMLY